MVYQKKVCQANFFRLTMPVLLTLFVLSGSPTPVHAERIYRCPQLNAPPLFSGTPCASAHQLAPIIANGYQPPTLTPAEQEQLQRLKQQLVRKQAARKKEKLRAISKAKSVKSSVETSNSACERQQEALQALHNRRRKGYKLSEAARLEQQEQGLRQNIRLYC